MPERDLPAKKRGLFYRFKTVRLLSFLISFLAIGICFLGFGGQNKVEATNYYVDSSITDTFPASATPDCTNYNTATFACSGGSSSAYKTIADINAGSFSGDDQILFRKGQTWREQLTVPSSGTSGHPITFGAFGSGEKPIINGADLIGTWTANPGSWVSATSFNLTNAQHGTDTRQRREKITPSQSGSKVRVTLKAGDAEAGIDGTSIGLFGGTEEWDYSGAPTRITWDGGSNTTTIASNATKVSDEITYAVTAATPILIHIYWAGEYSIAYGSGA